ncbi:hypothetical protein SAMN05216248_103389, partial [Pseudomonas simiae]
NRPPSQLPNLLLPNQPPSQPLNLLRQNPLQSQPLPSQLPQNQQRPSQQHLLLPR